MVPKALCGGEKKKQEDGTHRLGCVFQGEKNIYESNLKHARPRADFKNGNSKEHELVTGTGY